MENQELEGGLEVLEADLAETENSVYHLVRSNVELAQFLEETPGDADLEQAVAENKLVLVKKRHRIKALRNAISDLRAQHPHLAAAVAAAAAASDTATVSGAGAAHDDAISTMAASMSLDAQPAAPPAGDMPVGVLGGGSAAIAAPDATTSERSCKQSEEKAQGVVREEGGGESGDDGRGGVLL